MIRKGDWIQTVSGKQFWPLDPRPDEIDIYDIGHSLSYMCRFNGHCIRYYSVSEHSYNVSSLLDDEDKAWGLLHDATEAFLADITRPVKPYLTNYIEIENNLMKSIAERFGLKGTMPNSVKIADNAMLATEMKQIMATPPMDWKLTEEPVDIKLMCLNPEEAKQLFLQKANELELL